MKFEYDEDDEPVKYPVAILDSDGDLWFEYDEGWACIHEYALVTAEHEPSDEYEIVKRFYPGDKLTITF